MDRLNKGMEPADDLLALQGHRLPSQTRVVEDSYRGWCLLRSTLVWWGFLLGLLLPVVIRRIVESSCEKVYVPLCSKSSGERA